MVERRPGATREAVRGAEEALGVSLPEDYVAFMLEANGGEVSLGESWLRLWPVEELAWENEGYNVEEYAPGLVLFGMDGGLEAFGFDMRFGEPRVVAVPFVPMNWGDAVPCGPTFTGFLDRLRRGGCLYSEGGQEKGPTEVRANEVDDGYNA